MRAFRAWVVRLLAALGLQPVRRDIDAELEAHVALHMEDAKRAGMTGEEARRQALIRLGGAEQTRQAYRDRATLPSVESILQDVRYGVRQMLRAPGFAVTAVITLALGIGANIIIYTLVDSILLQPLPYAHQEQLVRITGTTSPAFPKGWIREMGSRSRAFSAVAGYGPNAESNVSEGDRPDRVFGAEVTVNALDTLGIHPEAGTFFRAEDAIARQDHDVVLSYGYWRARFGGSPSAIGSQIRIDGVSRRIAGVMPPGVHFPYADTQFVVPVAFRGDNPFDPWSDFNLQEFGRLAPGVSVGRAQAEVRQLRSTLVPVFPWRMPDVWASDMMVAPLLESQTGAMRPKLMLLLGAVALILLIACANVANMMLARSTTREREIAVRGALGASGRRLVQQLLSESVLMGVTAGAVALVAAATALRVFVRLLPADTPRIAEIAMHGHEVAFTLAASVLAGLLFGMIPSLRMSSINLLETLRVGGRGMVGKRSNFSVSMMLVMAQIGLSVMVITTAGLMLRSLYRLSEVDPGFRTNGVVSAEVSMDSGACRDQGRCRAFFDALLQRGKGIAGVENMALADALPLGGKEDNFIYDAEDHPRDARAGALLATGRTVTPEYFSVLGLHLVQGRLLSPQDASGTSRAVVVNQSVAQRLWPNQNPIGKHVLSVDDEPSPAIWNAEKALIVVGVVSNMRDAGLDGAFHDAIYLPLTPEREQPVLYALVRSRLSPTQTASGLRRAVESIDSLVPVTRIRSLNEVVATSMATPRSLAVLLLGFGALAVLIGAVGVYSLIAYMVGWRVREFGLRMALGAQRRDIVISVLRQSLRLAVGGCVMGIAGSAVLGRVLRSFLFEVSPFDPLTLSTVALLMGVIALLAAWIPASRAAAVDPMEALRAE